MAVRSEEHTGNKGLFLIAVFEVIKAGLFVVAAAGVFHLVNRDTQVELTKLLHAFRISGDSRFVKEMLVKADVITNPTKRIVSGLLLLYAALHATEGIGLLLRKRWAEYITVIMTGIFHSVRILHPDPPHDAFPGDPARPAGPEMDRVVQPASFRVEDPRADRQRGDRLLPGVPPAAQPSCQDAGSGAAHRGGVGVGFLAVWGGEVEPHARCAKPPRNKNGTGEARSSDDRDTGDLMKKEEGDQAGRRLKSVRTPREKAPKAGKADAPTVEGVAARLLALFPPGELPALWKEAELKRRLTTAEGPLLAGALARLQEERQVLALTQGKGVVYLFAGPLRGWLDGAPVAREGEPRPGGAGVIRRSFSPRMRDWCGSPAVFRT